MRFSTDMVPSNQEPLSQVELLAMQFLMRYKENSAAIMKISIRDWFQWCTQYRLDILHDVKRVHIELYIKHLSEVNGNIPSTVAAKMGHIRSFYKMCVADDILAKNPCDMARIPKVYMDNHRLTSLNRTELFDYIETARKVSPWHGALAVMLGILGLRATEAARVQVTDFEDQGGYKVLRLIGKGNKPATIPVPVSIWKDIEMAIHGREEGYILHRPMGFAREHPPTRQNVYGMVKTINRHYKGDTKPGPHDLRRSMITNLLNAGAPIRVAQIAARHEDPRTTARYDKGQASLDAHGVHTLAAFVSGAI